MFPYNAQRQQQDPNTRPEVHPGAVQYHYSPQPQAAQQQQRQAGTQQVQAAQSHFYPQQYPYYQQDPTKAAGQASAGAGVTPGAAQGTPQAAASVAAAPQPQMQMGDHFMQHVVPAMGYPQMYQPQGQQQVQGTPQEFPYGYRTNDYVFMMPHATAPMQQVHGQQAQVVSQTVTDPTGQAAPPGVKPKVSTTLWEDEGTLCFQVEARGICVARREDNDMINGTKLLNVAGMTRGRRDGLLKGERNRHVVKAGAMHLKGVWIPYDRALDFANKERIIDLLYPLFVTDIKSVLYHPTQRESQSQTQQNTPQPATAQPQVQPQQQAAQAQQAQVQVPTPMAQPKQQLQAQQTPQQQPAQSAQPRHGQTPQVPQDGGDDKKDKDQQFYQQQQYYYATPNQDYSRGYQTTQPQFYTDQQENQGQYKEEEQS